MFREVLLEDFWNVVLALEWDFMIVKELIDKKCWIRY